MRRRSRDDAVRSGASRQALLTLVLVAAVASALVVFGPAVDLGRYSASGQGGQFGGQFGGTVGGVGGFGGQFGGGFGGGFGGAGFGGGGGFGGQFGAQFGGTTGGSAPPEQCNVAGTSPTSTVGNTTVSIDGGLVVEAAVTPINDITVRQSDPTCFEVREEGRDPAAPLVSAGLGCRQIDAHLVSCRASIPKIKVDLNAGPDSLHVFSNKPLEANGGTGDDYIAGGDGPNTIDGGPGDDRLVGGSKADTYVGGLGADRIAAVDGLPDQIDCGGGNDTASVDLKDPDPLPRNCDQVDRSPVDSFPNLLIALRPTRARANGTVPVKVGCSPLWKPACKGTFAIDTGRGRHPAKLGALKYRLRPKKIVTLNVPLSRRGRAYVSARRKRTLRFVAQEKDSKGRPKTVAAHVVVRRR